MAFRAYASPSGNRGRPHCTAFLGTTGAIEVAFVGWNAAFFADFPLGPAVSIRRIWYHLGPSAGQREMLWPSLA
ncbi:hypothetical protein NITHO_220003 [Nitrolancea hollandica Lb]|uniref:Uncharacterized protein n=1 Tax=Nitrolancea hollandica Lb TaxID=1129897 RepID=I4EF39_9BACT|nr:hypothetical protein NITHO_220003 [Nitrolancea hollandica Lb]